MIALIICKSNFVPLLEGLCSSNSCRLEFLGFGVFAGIELTKSEVTVLHSDQLSYFYIVSDTKMSLENVVKEQNQNG